MNLPAFIFQSRGQRFMATHALSPPGSTASTWRSFLLLLLTFVLLFLAFDQAFAHGMSEEEKQSIIDGGNWSYLWLGATHMLSGYDHLAFVFGIVFFLTSFRDVVKYVTAFTVGHSVTLIYATFNAIQMNYLLIDAVIGLSVCYIAFSNLDGFRKYLNINPPNMLLMIVLLGLIHGFGLSTRLQALPLNEDQLLMNIISFNVGIELGQIGALVVMLVIISAWRKSRRFEAFSAVTNYGLILLGALLFLMQMHGYQHTANAEEFSNAKETVAGQTGTASQVGNEAGPWKETLSISIPARSDKEFKLYVEEGNTFHYEWQTNGEPLFFDLHAEPINDTSGYFESFNVDTSSNDSGTLSAPFSGMYGWYWKNSSRIPVVITLKTSGDYLHADALSDLPKKPEEPAQRKSHESIF
ncbi:MAG: HupE/UreJ family protein [Pseudomonadales bacterium]